ncbi:TetR/AcrR family transcriptional regulator [Amycolatopsis keratiniphila]|uniref:TetR/AcrR family transcriptional regulator n=1 Tax=Amycolatopsis keratiniphila TaxID=129921 RepID=UPI00087BE49F|nr:TetR/AcrR family transcriptional regulator [Amycolatopsis keratiniphila]OLZ54846.1 TetR family transcriptional regulator [Amycolatopsis keratiniphila subsp. nogabecina]SDU65488.1 DNA-binding transcriptional regulator, AcrR family [Amycolatopsis keratiniphila]
MESVRVKYAEHTRQALFDTGLRLFAEREYASLSAEELVRAAGLTRGALYHHFDGKRGLFEAVVDELEHQAADRIRTAIASSEDPVERTERGVTEFLAVCAEPRYRHVVLLQGPIALGWRRWRELDQKHLSGLVDDTVQAMLATSRIRPHPARLVAAAFYGALTELALVVAETDDPDQARAQAAALVHDLIAGLTTR